MLNVGINYCCRFSYEVLSIFLCHFFLYCCNKILKVFSWDFCFSKSGYLQQKWNLHKVSERKQSVSKYIRNLDSYIPKQKQIQKSKIQFKNERRFTHCELIHNYLLILILEILKIQSNMCFNDHSSMEKMKEKLSSSDQIMISWNLSKRMQLIYGSNHLSKCYKHLKNKLFTFGLSIL